MPTDTPTAPTVLPTLALEGLSFDNTFVRDLPGDPSSENRPRQVYGACWSPVQPTSVADPRLVAHAAEVASDVGLGDDDFADPEKARDIAAVFGGNALDPGMEPYAACYGGHQFGHWAGQLGDGRAITLGEVVHGGRRFELQLKGAGPTPYSRMADGRAVLRSSIREFLCSEAMHHLGVPTTRALSLVTTGDEVMRDMFYDGRPELEPGAVVCRVAPSFLRFGNFQVFSAREDTETLRRLVGWAIRTHFPELSAPAGAELPKETILEWLAEISRRTAEMIVHWQRVGFVHGVMNTDNMSILGLTIDYGPYGWLDDYDPDWTPNTTDAQGRRYRFGYQPDIALWNLARLAEALHPLIGEVEPLEEAVLEYRRAFAPSWANMMARKLGLEGWRPGDDGADGDRDLVEDLEELLRATETDMTIFYRRLATIPSADGANGKKEEVDDEALLDQLQDAYYDPESARTGEVKERTLAWLKRYRRRLADDGLPDAERATRMNRVNPKYVPRNYLAQQVIRRAEAGETSAVGELLDVLRLPYDEQPEHEELAARRPEWARHEPGCSMLSCSS